MSNRNTHSEKGKCVKRRIDLKGANAKNNFIPKINEGTL